MNQAAKPRKKMVGRLVAKLRKGADVNGAAAPGTLVTAQTLEAPSLYVLSAAAPQARDEVNVNRYQGALVSTE